MSNKIPETAQQVAILYEDDDCAVVDKPAGLMVHGDGRAAGPFLADWIAEHFPQAKDVGDPMNAPDGSPLNRAGIVHRLDRETSGAIIIAKTAAGHASLKQQFKDRRVEKEYLAVTWGAFDEEFGTIDRPIGRSGNDFRRWSAGRGMRGEIRDAETYWTRLGVTEIPASENVPANLDKTVSVVRAEPKTGRTHQIRVHFQSVNHPVVGDTLYGPKRPYILGFKRLALHSRSIKFDDAKGRKVEVVAPVPADFKEALRRLSLESSIEM